MWEDNEFQQVLNRYMTMVSEKRSLFFDVDEFEDIIDYYLDDREFENAYEAARLGILQHTDSGELKIKLVHIHLEAGKPNLALEILNEFSQIEKKDPEYFLLKGTSLVQLTNFREAEKCFDHALEASGDDMVEVLINISIAFENARQYKYALKYLLMALELEPDNLSVIYDIAYYYERTSEYPRSISYYNLYLDQDPFSENVWYNLGVIYFKTNDWDKALECYDYAIAINPSYGSAYFNKANIYANNGNYLRAIKVYNEFLEIEPKNLQGWSYLGECYEETGNFDKSLEIYKKIISIDNTYPEGWYGAGLSLMNKDQLTDAVTYILKAIEFDRENPEYWFTLGEIYELQDLASEARKCYRNVCMLDPEDRESWIRLSRLYIDEFEYADALVVLREAYQNNFNCQDIIFMMSAVYYKLGDEQAGLSFLEKGLEIGKGGLKLFYSIYPEGVTDETIKKLLGKK